jgi:hypothetical protein
LRDHTKLKAFKLADETAVLIYRITKSFPKEEICGLASQMRRSAVSVPSNIVEGCARESQIEYLRCLGQQTFQHVVISLLNRKSKIVHRKFFPRMAFFSSEKFRFLEIAFGSLRELNYQFVLAGRLS